MPEASVFLQEHLFDLPLKYYRPLGNPSKFIQALLVTFSRAKDEDISPDEYSAFTVKQYDNAVSVGEKEAALKQIEVAKAYKKYEELKLKYGFVDFGDQVRLVLELFRRHPSVLKQVQNRFKYILVDEFQDTNYSQFEITKMLSEPNRNVTVVGDDDQAIYKFRGACLSNILNFLKVYPDAMQVVLTRNYRSTQVILDYAYKLITHNNPERLEYRNNIDKRLQAKTKRGKRVEHFVYDGISSESDGVAKRISDMIRDEGYQPGDFAILVRANADADPFMKSLNYFSVPWQFSGNAGLYHQPAIIHLLSFLRTVAAPDDSASLYYLSQFDPFNISSLSISQINRVAAKTKRSIFSVIKNMDKLLNLKDYPKEESEKLKYLLNEIIYYLNSAKNKSTGHVLYDFLSRSGILGKLASSSLPEDIRRAQDIAQFFRVVQRFSEVAAYDRVNVFVDSLGKLINAGADPAISELDPNINAVNILTVHKAKGLEFPVVFMVSLVSDKFPTRSRRDQIELPEGLIKDILPAGDVHIQEERRLFYVGMTRAEKILFLTSARDYGGKRLKKVSRFVQEVLDKPQADTSIITPNAIEVIERFGPIPDLKEKIKAAKKEDDRLLVKATAIDDYLTCPLKYKFVHVLRIPVLRHHAAVYGNAVHEGLKVFHERLKLGMKMKEDELIKIYQDNWVSEGFLSREHEEKRYRRGEEVLRNYYKVETKRGVLPGSVEEGFKLKFEGFYVVGRWDRADIENGKAVIIDYKTSDIRDQKEADKRARQSLQLSLYALGYAEKFGRMPDELRLYFLESNLTGTAMVKPDNLEDVKEKVVKVSEGIKKEAYPPDANYYACNLCAFLNICPSGEK